MIENWWDLAKCKGKPLAMFFPVGRFDSGPYQRTEARALAVCAGCPVRYDCLGDAVARGDGEGVLGGVGEQARRALITTYKHTDRAARAQAAEEAVTV